MIYEELASDHNSGMTSVAFFRNLNQGQRSSPSTAQLLEAFSASGALEMRPVRSNGTVVFDAAEPEECLAGVVAQLHATSAWGDVAFVRDAGWLAERATQLREFATPQLVELSLFDDGVASLAGLPLRGKGCEVVLSASGYAITVNDAPGTSQATPTLERALATPVTSRSASTVLLIFESL